MKSINKKGTEVLSWTIVDLEVMGPSKGIKLWSLLTHSVLETYIALRFLELQESQNTENSN